MHTEQEAIMRLALKLEGIHAAYDGDLERLHTHLDDALLGYFDLREPCAVGASIREIFDKEGLWYA